MKTLTIVRILRGVKPYGGRKFVAYRDSNGEWLVDVKSDLRDPWNTQNSGSPMSFWTAYGARDWRTYRADEINVMSTITNETQGGPE